MVTPLPQSLVATMYGYGIPLILSPERSNFWENSGNFNRFGQNPKNIKQTLEICHPGSTQLHWNAIPLQEMGWPLRGGWPPPACFESDSMHRLATKCWWVLVSSLSVLNSYPDGHSGLVEKRLTGISVLAIQWPPSHHTFQLQKGWNFWGISAQWRKHISGTSLFLLLNINHTETGLLRGRSETPANPWYSPWSTRNTGICMCINYIYIQYVHMEKEKNNSIYSTVGFPNQAILGNPTKLNLHKFPLDSSKLMWATVVHPFLLGYCYPHMGVS